MPKKCRNPDHTTPPKATDGKKTKQETCLVCEVVIQDGDDISDKGEDAVFCKGICQAWIHRRCLGLSKKLYDNLGKSNDPFLCVYCALHKQSQEIDELERLISPLTSPCVDNQGIQTLSKEISHLKSKLESDSSSQVEQVANTNSISGNKKRTQVRLKYQVPRQVLNLIESLI